MKENIGKTIGIEHEVLHFDNSAVNRGICSVYNLLAAKAKYPYLCFVHEDVLFQTEKWGKTVINSFKRMPDLGVLGVAGSRYKSKALSGWYTGNGEMDCAQIIHRYPEGDELIYSGPKDQQSLQKVVCVDGVFICSRKNIWQKCRFNETDLPGFHFYDLDFSLNAAKISTVVVCYDIKLVHITRGGDFGDAWIETAFKFHRLAGKNFPVTKLVPGTQSNEEAIQRTWLDVLKKYKISLNNKMKWITLQKLYKNPGMYYAIAKFICYQPLGLKYVHKLFKRI